MRNFSHLRGKATGFHGTYDDLVTAPLAHALRLATTCVVEFVRKGNC